DGPVERVAPGPCEEGDADRQRRRERGDRGLGDAELEARSAEHVVHDRASSSTLGVAATERGSRMATVVPTPFSLWMASVPPCAETIADVMPRPRPVPLAVCVASSARKYGVAIFGRSSAEMPIPLSETVTVTSDPSATPTMRTRPCSGVYLMALLTRLSMTWRMRN